MGYSLYYSQTGTITDKEWSDITTFIKNFLYVQQNSLNVEISMFKRDSKGHVSLQKQRSKTKLVEQKSKKQKHQLFAAKYSKDKIEIYPVFQDKKYDDGPRVEPFVLYRKPNSVDTHKEILSQAMGVPKNKITKTVILKQRFFYTPGSDNSSPASDYKDVNRKKYYLSHAIKTFYGNSYQKIYAKMLTCILSYVKCRIPQKILWNPDFSR